jgi:3,4-dihydroxy 2-butanone 4-phosphate synthase / GTP cyclohydrolase II
VSFAPVPELVAEIRAGRMIVLVDDEDRENEGDLVMAAECVRPEDVNFMAREARGLICLSLAPSRCAQLGLGPMVGNNGSPYGTNFTVSIEAASGVTTGISAHDRAHTIRTAVARTATARDLTQPGHVFPLAAQPGGVLVRAGHTEAAYDLAGMAGFEPAGVLVEILDEDGSMARRPQLERFAAKHGLKIGSIEDLIRHRLAHERLVECVLERDVTTDAGRFRLHVFRSALDGALHHALVRGDVAARAPLVRVHVQDPLADALGVHELGGGVVGAARALREIASDGCGVLVVLAGGDDRRDALQRLAGEPQPGHGGNWRRSGLGAQILRALGLARIRVLGAPRRFPGLSGFGIEVVEYVAPHE